MKRRIQYNPTKTKIIKKDDDEIVPRNFFDEDFDFSEVDDKEDSVLIPSNFFDDEYNFEDDDYEHSQISQIFKDNPLPSPISTQMLDGRRETSGTGGQDGYGINEGAGPSNAPDLLTSLETSGSIDVTPGVVLVEKRRRQNRKYNAEEISYNALIDIDQMPQHVRGASLATITDVIRTLFSRILMLVTSGLDLHDLIRICIIHDLLDRPISTGLMEVGAATVETVMTHIMKVLQSKDTIRLNEGFSADIITIRRPRGGGRRKINIPDIDRLKKNSIVCIHEDEYEVCCAKAILLSLAYLSQDAELNTLRNPRNTLLLRRAIALHSATGVPEGPCGIDEIQTFERYLNVQVVVISTTALNKVIYKGPQRERKVYLWLNGNHFDVIRSPAGFYASKNYCGACEHAYNSVADHRCVNLCHICRTAECKEGDSIRCADCDRNCRSIICFDTHKKRGICDKVYQCRRCCRVILRKQCSMELHRCDRMMCPSCKKFVPENHLCYLQKIDAKSPNDKLIFFDFETDQSTGEHVVNFAVAQYFDGTEKIFHGYDALDKFCRFLFSRNHKDYTAIAHNMKGFDGQFILQWLLQQGQAPEVIPNGSKIMSLLSKSNNIRIIDSFNFLPMSLAKLPKTFGLDEIKKGYFPHLFNIPENQAYVGELPSEKFYSPDSMATAERAKFLRWYEERKCYPFNFKEEMLDYCRSDVDILRRCCLEFREQFISVANVDPFCYVTIASACMATYRSNHIQPETIAMIPSNGYINRTNYSRDSIRWLDFIAATEDVVIQHALNDMGEYKINNVSVDGYCSQNNTVYQFHGCFYHGCSHCYDADVRNPVTACTMGDLFQRTADRSRQVRDRGFNLIEIWEHSFQRMKKENEDLKKFLISHDVCDRLNPRDAFFGGRTNAVQLFFEGQAKYVDFTSLYPWVNKYCRYPIGHPTIITEGFSEVEEYFGLIKCRILPPRRLYHPVLPYRCQGKLMFPLCKTCAETCSQDKCSHTEEQRAILGVWITEEVKKAKEKGYKILKIYEVYHFSSSSCNLFKSYIDLFLKIKQEASGWPAECTTEETKKAYLEEYLSNEGVTLDTANISVNPGRRSVAKLALNSFWGRWGMKCNKDRLSFVTTVPEFNKLLCDRTKEIKDIILPSAEVAAVTWCQYDEFVTNDTGTNVFLAAFTTCYARLKLYSVLESLNKDVLYYDTDSVIYKSNGSNDPKLGNFLGQFTDELNGDTICTFVSGGPKNYAYLTSKGETVCKIRGFSLNYINSRNLNFDSVKSLVLNMDCKQTIAIYNPSKISRDAKRRRVFNKEETKLYKIVYTKRVIVENYNTLPYGY